MIKVLIVDDSALMRKLMGEIFVDQTEFEIAFARNGLEALEKLPGFAPDVVTLDVNMPVMDGLACLNRIMLERPTPVVMVSSLTAAGADTTLEALRLGAVEVVAKPSGALSLGFHEMSAMLLEKVRTASSARLPSSLRLTDRIRHRVGAPVSAGTSAAADRKPVVSRPRLTGSGLVLVGTSTGGPPALEAVITGLPGNFPWPILIVQHMPAMFTAALARRLNGISALTVTEISNAESLLPGHAYIARGDADVVVSRSGDRLIASTEAPLEGYLWRPSVDRMVRSAMEHVEASHLIGVMMTGMGSDGAAAMTALRAAGGRTIAESEDTAVVWGMPGELAKAGGADWVVPLQEIGPLIMQAAPPCL